ncbi:MAG: Gfo/Idh/MocA family oxidoreductase [Gammaproteobacteria bacterium]
MRKRRKNCIAVIGCGYWGKNIVRNFHDIKGLAVVCDNEQDIADKFANEYGVPEKSFPEILNSSEIHGVAIATPAEQHYGFVKEALLAGKHVFVEKPLALRVEQGEELCQIAEKSGLILMVGHLLQYHPGFIRLKEIVKNGELGRLQYIYSQRLNLGKVRREENILWSFAPHDISMILALVGSEPENVSAVGSSYLHKNIADVTITNLSFPGGENAHIFVSWLHPFKEQKMVIVGENGMLVFDDQKSWGSKLIKYPHRILWKDNLPVPEKAEGVNIEVSKSEPLKNECKHFINCISGIETCRTDGREGLRVLRVLNAAEESMALQRVFVLNEFNPGKTPTNIYIHDTAVIDYPCEIGEGTKIWHFSHILEGSNIGRNCIIGQNVMIGPDVVVGDNCKIQNNVSIYKGVTLEDHVFCGPSCVFTNVNTPRAEIERKDEFLSTHVGRGATIGANATIICGSSLGQYCFIAAGAVVTKEVPPYALMAGIPAKRTGWVSHTGEQLGPDLVCPRSGRKYIEKNKDCLEELDE